MPSSNSKAQRSVPEFIAWPLLATASSMLYAAMLYFRAATASLDDGYQPGIEALQAWARPSLLLAIAPLLAIGTRSTFMTRLAVANSICATLICAILLVVVSVHPGNANTWQFPQDRSLEETIRIALISPNFSGHSKGRIVVSGAIALTWLCISALFAYRRRRHWLHTIS